jgi:electron transfer flavoprotein alpha subunit
MGTDHSAVWVIAEQIDCHLQSVSLQLIGHQLQTSVEVILLGDNIEQQARQLIAAGADRIYLGNAPELEVYQPELYAEIVVKLAAEHQPEIILIGSTDMGRELAPLVAARLKTGLTAHCIDFVLDKELILEQRIPAYGPVRR